MFPEIVEKSDILEEANPWKVRKRGSLGHFPKLYMVSGGLKVTSRSVSEVRRRE